ncbi:hypothetical protein [Paenarthrobacter sp. YIM B13468]|uniref:hypothetical protein n=1 Tax=Paenarthrobacter sp. YIM B13468 TaxID=3366295 RepID=UPI00366F0CFC
MSTSRVNWRNVSEDDFNTFAESLIVRERTRDGLVGQAVDGRGGDGGVDIDVRVERTGQLTEILQLKWFPEGFSNKFSDRRKQIRHSLERAMEHQPPVWTLVVPCKLTPAERKSILAMREGRGVLIRFIDSTVLDLLLAEYPDVHDWATRDVGLDALSRIGREQSVLAKPNDLAGEAILLHNRADGISAYWGRNWTVKNGCYVEELYAKRPDAHLREPLSFVLEASFGPGDAELHKKFERSFGYGLIEPLVLPEHVVTSFTKVGPEWFAGSSDFGGLRLEPSEAVNSGLKMAVTLTDDDGRRIHSISGRTSGTTIGWEGMTLTGAFGGGLVQRWFFPKNLAQEGTLELTFKPAGHSAREIQRIIAFLESLQDAAKISVTVDGKTSELGVPQEAAADAYEPNEGFRELIDDLAFIETDLNVEFEFPEDIPGPMERVWIRVVRRMLSGGCVVLPEVNGFSVTLNGKRSIADSGLFGEGAALFIRTDEWSVNIVGEELFIGSMGVYHPGVVARDGAGHLAALKAGTAAGRRVHFKPTDGTPFRIFSPARMSPATTVAAQPWALTGIPEHPKLESMPAITDGDLARGAGR